MGDVDVEMLDEQVVYRAGFAAASGYVERRLQNEDAEAAEEDDNSDQGM